MARPEARQAPGGRGLSCLRKVGIPSSPHLHHTRRGDDLDMHLRIASLERARDPMKRTLPVALAAALFIPAAAAAQEWPTKTVKIVVPFGPGSTPDMGARVIDARLPPNVCPRL